MSDSIKSFLKDVEEYQRIADDIQKLQGEVETLRAALDVEKIRNSSLQTQLRDAKAHIEKLKSVPAAWEVTYTPVYQK